MTPTVGRLRWMFQKYRHILDSLVLGRSPEFVRRRSPGSLGNEIPVFTFHLVLPEAFERQCRYLVRNGYRTLSAEEFRRRLAGEDSSRDPAILLTFDDGLKHVWSVAFPLLQKYGLKATCFLIPGCIPEGGPEPRKTLKDVWAERADEEDVVAIREGEPPLATWVEIRRMQESGVVDFHSHTMHHALVPTSERVFDYAGPHYDPYFFGNIHVPLYTRDGEDVTSREPVPGLPIFHAAPRMQADRRFFPHEDLLRECVDHVSREGADRFFVRSDWRRVLSGIVDRFRDRHGNLGRFESTAERNCAVRHELESSRRVIESRLPGARVTHLSYPWFDAKPFAVEAAREVGFETVYFGPRPGRSTNRPGQDPCDVVRVEELFLERLPGEGRSSLREVFGRLLELRSLPGRVFSSAAGAETSS